MSELQGVPPADRRRFRTGRASLDFAHTGGEGPFARWELLHTGADLARWLGVVLDGLPVEPAGDPAVADARALRAAIWDGAHRVIAWASPTARQRSVINAAARHAPPVPRLTADGATVERPVHVDAALSLVARDAVDLFAGPLAGRIRVCAAHDCQLLFVDQSRPGQRRWCSMQRCGNLAKVRAYRDR